MSGDLRDPLPAKERETSMRKRVLKQNKDGFGMIIAIAIMAVLMMLGLALLLVSFSLYSTAGRQQDTAQCREIAQSLSRELEYEICIPYTEAYKAGAADKYPLWFYLRYNVMQNSWKSFNSDERGHMADYAYRYFNVGLAGNPDKTKELTDGVSVLMYWIGEDNVTEGDAAQLVVSVTCEKGKSKSTITTYYELNIDDGDEVKGEEDNNKKLSGGEDYSKENINPNNNSIDEKEKWSWGKNERE